MEKKSKSLLRIVLLREKHILTKMHVQADRLYFYLHFALDIIPDDHCDGKTPKTTILFKLNLIFWWQNLVKMLLFEKMLVLTPY